MANQDEILLMRELFLPRQVGRDFFLRVKQKARRRWRTLDAEYRKVSQCYGRCVDIEHRATSDVFLMAGQVIVTGHRANPMVGAAG